MPRAVRLLRRVLAVHLDVPFDQRLEQIAAARPEGPLVGEDLTQQLVLVEGPVVHRGDQDVARDEVQLECQEAEEQVTVGGNLGHDLTSGSSDVAAKG